VATADRAHIYHGWRVVGAAFVVALFGWGIGFYGPGIYLVALRERHGWSTAEIASAITTYYLLGATLILFVGGAFERFGARTVVSAGAAAMAGGILLLPLVSQPWQVYGAFAVMSFGWAAMSGAAINIIIAPWFDRRRGLAISLALNGASAGGIVIAPLLILLISRLGFAAALAALAALTLLVVLPTAAFVMRPKRPDERDHAGDGARAPTGPESSQARPWQASAMVRDWHFQTIAIPFALGLMAQVGFLTHQVAYLTPLLGGTGTGWAVGLTTSAAIAGRLLLGLFVDALDRRAVACGNFLVQVIGMGLLATTQSAPLLLAGCVLFGLGLGNLVSVPGLIVQREFRKEHFARIVAMIVAINQFTFAFGPGLLGYLQRIRGDYTAALVVCLAIEIAAAVLVMLPRFVGHGRR
jgi:MFS family permease